MNAELTLEQLVQVQAHFGLPSPALVEKDFYVVKALSAIAAVELDGSTGDARGGLLGYYDYFRAAPAG